MFSRSRRKIILSIMGSLILLFAITLSVILFASYREIRQKNRNMLEQHAELYNLEQGTGKQDELLSESQGEESGTGDPENQLGDAAENPSGTSSGAWNENASAAPLSTPPATPPGLQQGVQPGNPPGMILEGQFGTPPEMPSGEQPGNPPEMPSGEQPGNPPEMPSGEQPGNPQEMPFGGQPENSPGMQPGDQAGAPPKMPSGGQPGNPLDKPPDLGRPPLDTKPDYQLSTFYSVAFGEGETVLAVDTGEKEVYSKEELVSLAQEILAGGREFGRDGNLMYIVRYRPNYTLVAFMDNTVSESELSTLLRNVLVIGGTAILAMFFISLYLSKWIIQPLEENDKRQKRFVSDASHELKTPVAVIETNAEMLQREIGENEWLSNILYENDRMSGLVGQLLELSRAENAEAPMEQVDFSRIVNGETLAFETVAFDQGKILQCDIEDGILLTGNKTQLTQLVSVLLDNAVRHSTGSGIDVSLKNRAHMAVFSVVNEGAEIPLEQQAHLFDRFYQVDEARNSEGRHYGLGLSIAKAVAEKHGGRISVSCYDGKVQFTVSLPIKK